MEKPNNFGEYYKTLSDAELLNVLDNSCDYQPSAVEAAKKELLGRQLSETEITEAREILKVNYIRKEKRRQRIREIEGKMRSTGSSLIETINPIQSGIPSTERKIRLIVIVFGGIFLYSFFKDFDMHVYFIEDIPRYPFTSMLYLLSIIILPISLFPFWKKLSVGWIFFAIYLTFSTVVTIWTLVQTILWEPSGNSIFDNVFGPPPFLTLIIRFLFFSGVLYLVCKRDIRNVFLIGENKMTATIIITGAFSFFAVYVTS